MKLKVWTVVGTRPEIIRLSSTIKLFDQLFDHILIHTGQNFGAEMSDVFFEDLELRSPDVYLGVGGSNLGQLVGDIFRKFGDLLADSKPDAIVVLGDTNSALVTILARREGVATYHLEAGNRAFDARVPEETNRRIIDHTADFNVAYNSYSRNNLLREGLDPARVFVSGSPMLEVISALGPKIDSSKIVNRLGLESQGFLVGSFHRQENVDRPASLERIIQMASEITNHLNMPMVLSLHPRTRDKANQAGLNFGPAVMPIKPLGIVDYLALQKASYATISDSGTLAEESAILGFVGVSAREATERPEAHDLGRFTLASSSTANVLEAIQIASHRTGAPLPEGYDEAQFSVRVANLVSSTARRREFLIGGTGNSST